MLQKTWTWSTTGHELISIGRFLARIGRCSVTQRNIAFCFAFLVLVASTHASGDSANLVANGGFESDSDGDGVPDGWLGNPFNFSQQTLESVQDHIRSLPPHDQLLAKEVIKAADGWVIAKRRASEDWDADYKTDASYKRLVSEDLPQNSRFATLPVPEQLDLGGTTLVLNALKPMAQVISEPIPVKPNSGYRLTYWFRTSGAPSSILFQVLDTDAPPGTKWPYGGVVAARSLGWAWVPQWTRYELRFRTGPYQTAVRIRPWVYFAEAGVYFPEGGDGRRMWYDDFRLVEDDSVKTRAGDISKAPNPEPDWPDQVRARGYAVIARPTFPVTCHDYMPRAEEVGAAVRLHLAAGEIGSVVIFVRSLGKHLKLRASPFVLRSENGYAITTNGHGAASIYLRAAEYVQIRDFQRIVTRPEVLKNSNELSVEANDSGQFWLTIEVPPGTPPGNYRGDMTITPVGLGEQAKLPVVVRVRDMQLLESDAAFGMWSDIRPLATSYPDFDLAPAAKGSAFVLPGAHDIYLADQRRHGMNTATVYGYAERKDKNGQYHVRFNELDTMVAAVKRSGLCSNHPLILLTWSDLGVPGGFGCLAGKEQAVMSIYRHGKESDWPDLLFTVLDEVRNSDERRRQVEEHMKYYTPARKQGVRTVTAAPDLRTQAQYYDVCIESMYQTSWDYWHGLANKHGSELWFYDCALTGRNPVWERFIAGLWTWRTGVKGNMVWAYGWYVRINESGVPESKTAWEGRLAGVNDYRYLHTLEQAISAAVAAGNGEHATVKAAVSFLDRLRARVTYWQIPYDGYQHPTERGSSLNLMWNPINAVLPEDYDRIREQCAQHTIAIGRECG